MSSCSKKDDLNLTKEEYDRLAKAFKDKEFLKMFSEYAEEISNPENRAIYEKEIRQMEEERGMDVKFVKPDPGHVLKTIANGSVKAFINVCKNENVGLPVFEKKNHDGKSGVSWSIPHIFSPPREDFAKDKKTCSVYDFVIHPDTYRMAETNERFKKMVNDLALDGVEKMFNISLDKNNVKLLKMKYKGRVVSTVIRNKIPDAQAKKPEFDDILQKFPYPYNDESSAEKTQRILKENSLKSSKVQKSNEGGKNNDLNKNSPTKKDDLAKDDDGFTTPKYQIKHQSNIDLKNYANEISNKYITNTRPDKLVMEIHMPLLNSAAPIELDVFEKSVKLVSLKPAKYKLEVDLPYPVDENSCSAKFDKTKHTLTIVMPVIPLSETMVNFTNDTATNVDGNCSSTVSNTNHVALITEVNLNGSGDNRGEPVCNDVNETLMSNDELKTKCNNNIRSEIDKCEQRSDSENDEKNLSDDSDEQKKDSVESLRNGVLQHKDNLTLDFKKTESEFKKGVFKKELYSMDKAYLGECADMNDIDDEDKHNIKPEQIIIVHDKVVPQLQSILKSRTVSDSSADDNNAINYTNYNSFTVSENDAANNDDDEDDKDYDGDVKHGKLNHRLSQSLPISSSYNNNSSNYRKKSVKFNEHVDRTIYLINQSVCTLHATLKNKRKKMKKREQRQEILKMKEESKRRRRSSGSMSLDSSGGEDHNHDHLTDHLKVQMEGLKVTCDSDEEEEEVFANNNSGDDDPRAHREPTVEGIDGKKNNWSSKSNASNNNNMAVVGVDRQLHNPHHNSFSHREEKHESASVNNIKNNNNNRHYQPYNKKNKNHKSPDLQQHEQQLQQEQCKLHINDNKVLTDSIRNGNPPIDGSIENNSVVMDKSIGNFFRSSSNTSTSTSTENSTKTTSIANSATNYFDASAVNVESMANNDYGYVKVESNKKRRKMRSKKRDFKDDSAQTSPLLSKENSSSISATSPRSSTSLSSPRLPMEGNSLSLPSPSTFLPMKFEKQESIDSVFEETVDGIDVKNGKDGDGDSSGMNKNANENKSKNADKNDNKKKMIEIISETKSTSSSSGLGSSSSSSPPLNDDNSKERPEKPDTILSWKEGNSQVRDTNCPINFLNNHIFSLDLD